MAYSRLSMRKIFEVLRLSAADGRSRREIAPAIVASPTTVGGGLRRAKLAGLSYPLPVGLSETDVEALLYPSAPSKTRRPEPNWRGVHRELRRKGVTLDPTLADVILDRLVHQAHSLNLDGESLRKKRKPE